MTGTYHMARLNLADGLKNGQFPVRMGGFAYDGYGGVMSVFYPDTFLYPFALMILGRAKRGVRLQCLFRCAEHRRGAEHNTSRRSGCLKKRWAATGASILYACELSGGQRLYAHRVRRALAMVFLPLFLVNLARRGLRRLAMLEGTGAQRDLHLCSHMITTLFCAVLAAGFCLLHIRKIIFQKRLLPLVKAVLVCLLLCLYRIGPFVMYSMQGLGADDLFRNITEFSVELGQVLLMNAGTITRKPITHRLWNSRWKSACR